MLLPITPTVLYITRLEAVDPKQSSSMPRTPHAIEQYCCSPPNLHVLCGMIRLVRLQLRVLPLHHIAADIPDHDEHA
jgi:hypothetical protein